MFEFPHGDLHGLNLDWFLEQWKKFQNSFTGSFTATAQETASPNDPADVNVTYDTNTGVYNFAFDIPKGVKPTGYLIGYQEGTSGTTVPTGTWLATPPAVTQGNYLWSMTRVIYNDGTYSETYAVSRQGVDGAGSPATQNPLMDGTVAVGSSSKFAREDHRHPSDTSKLSTGALSNNTPTMDGTGASGTSVNVSRADHVHPHDTSKLDATAFVRSNTTPIMDGTGSAGTSSEVSRADHVHPTDTSRASATDLATLDSKATQRTTGTVTAGTISINTGTGSFYLIKQNNIVYFMIRFTPNAVSASLLVCNLPTGFIPSARVITPALRVWGRSSDPDPETLVCNIAADGTVTVNTAGISAPSSDYFVQCSYPLNL